MITVPRPPLRARAIACVLCTTFALGAFAAAPAPAAVQAEPISVGNAVRSRRVSGGQSAQPLRGEQLDAIQYDPDGALTLYVQNESPGKDKEPNWLPAPNGPFNLTMRLYAPKPEALIGKWSPPPATKSEAFMGLTGQ